MKSISAAVIVIAGVACFYVASLFPRTENTGTFVVIVGTSISCLALIGWFRTLGNPP
jgi:hypothetical protein